MRDNKKDENGFCGYERRRFSAKRRDEDLTEVLVVVMAFSSVCDARLSCLMWWWWEVGRVVRRVVRMRWRRGGCVRMVERKVVVWWRTVVDMVVDDGGEV